MPRATERRKAAARPPRAAKSAAAAGTASPASPAVAVAGFELDELRRLIRLVQRTGIGELELNSNGRSVRISATPAGVAAAIGPAAAASQAPA